MKPGDYLVRSQDPAALEGRLRQAGAHAHVIADGPSSFLHLRVDDADGYVVRLFDGELPAGCTVVCPVGQPHRHA